MLTETVVGHDGPSVHIDVVVAVGSQPVTSLVLVPVHVENGVMVSFPIVVAWSE